MIVVSDALFLPIVIQLKEMGGSSRPTESLKTNEQPTERKKGLTDWMNIIKPGNEEKDHWVMLAIFFWVECRRCGSVYTYLNIFFSLKRENIFY